ncbi:MAG TPA: hypothetical protein VE526_03270 [Solirubrobacteraceae bacterium]|jgi:hypothetical protein|nr:hypothetical protein [Solirubrobacteraceae bacterium]
MAPGDTALLCHELTPVGPDTVVGVPRDAPVVLPGASLTPPEADA